jgi:hypothetical protein
MAVTKANKERKKEVFDLLWKAENEGITEYKLLAEYVFQATGKKVSFDTIQQYKIDRNAQNTACGILLAQKQMALQYVDNPKLLFPELLVKIKSLKPNKVNQRVINILSWFIAIAITLSIYLFYNYSQKIDTSNPIEEIRITLNRDYTTSVFKGINKPSALVSGYLFVDFIEEVPAPIKGIILNKEKGLISINNIPMNSLINYLDGQYGQGELIIIEEIK